MQMIEVLLQKFWVYRAYVVGVHIAAVDGVPKRDIPSMRARGHHEAPAPLQPRRSPSRRRDRDALALSAFLLHCTGENQEAPC